MDIAIQAEMFANRIAKNHRHLRKWANREGIDCFRVYDRDIPELPFALDVYLDRALLHEYSRPVDGAREQVAALVGVQPVQVVFTSGGTEAKTGRPV